MTGRVTRRKAERGSLPERGLQRLKSIWKSFHKKLSNIDDAQEITAIFVHYKKEGATSQPRCQPARL
jgi:hypothetical protein